MPEKNLKILGLIPCFNEERTIGKILADFPAGVVEELLVINDGSTDRSPEEIGGAVALRRDVKITVIKHSQRRGAGFVVREAIDYGLKNGFDLFTLLSGNGKDNPRELPRLLQPLCDGLCDYVQGSRFLKGGSFKNLPFARKCLIKIFTWIFYRLAAGVKISGTDATNGFRAYRLSLFQDSEINIHQDWLDHYEMEIYIHAKALACGCRFLEVPVSKDYPFTKGYSKIRPFIDWIGILKPLILLKLGLRK